MAITIDKLDLGSTADNATATTVAFTTTQAVASNGFVVVSVTFFSPSAAQSLTGITDNSAGGPLGWAIDKQGTATGDQAHVAICSAQAPSGLASGTTITATFSESCTGRSICGSSFTGVLSSAALDTTSGVTNMPGTTAWATASTTIAAGSVLIGLAFGVNTNDTSTVTSPSIEAHDIPGAAGTFGSTTCYRIEASGAAYTVAGTWSGTEVGPVIAAAYKVGLSGITKAGSGIIGP